jgi:hypothetical protein
MAMAGTSGTRNGATRPSGSGRDAFFRMIAWPTAMGDVGSFAISSSITDTGFVISNPAWVITRPTSPVTITAAITSTGTQRRPDSRAGAMRPRGRSSGASIA